MANEFKITDVVDKNVFNQLKSLKTEFESTATSYSNFAAILAGGVKLNPKTIQELSNKSVSYNKALADLINTQNRMAGIQERQINLLDSLNKKMSALSSMSGLGKLFDDFALNVNKASMALESISVSSERASVAQASGARSTQQTANAMNDASKNIGLTNKAYTEIINSVTSYDEHAGDLNKKLSENKIRIDEIRSNLSMLDKEYKRGALSKDDYSKKSSELTIRERELSEQNKQYSALLRNHAQVMVSTAGSYNEMSASVLQLEKRYKNLGASQRNGIVGKEMLGQIDQLKSELKYIDSKMGDYQRNVGNYNSHWNGLGNSIQQVAREIPSVAYGWNVFFGAISNNIPILADELRKARIEFNMLRKAGGEATPVWKQVISSIFSWQTLLVAGITILTLYGQKIMDWAGSLIKGYSALKETERFQNAVNQAMRDANKDSKKETMQLDLLYKAATNVSKSNDERLFAIRRLKSEYPDYFGMMDDEEIKTGKASLAYKGLVDSIIASVKARRMESLVSKEQGTYLDYLGETTKAFMKLEEAKKRADNADKAFKESTTDYNAQEFKDAFNNLSGVQKAYDAASAKSFTQAKRVLDIANSIDVSKLYGDPKDIENASAKNKEFWETQRKNAISVLESIDEKEMDVLLSGKETGVGDEVIKKYKDAIKLRDEANSKISTYDDLSKTNKQVEKEEESHAKYMLRITNELNKAKASAIESERESEIDAVKAEYIKKLSIIKGNSEKELELRKVYADAQAKEIADINYKYDSEVAISNLENRLSYAQKYSIEELNLMIELNGMLKDTEIREAEKTGIDINEIKKKYAKKEEDIYSSKSNRIVTLMQEESAMRFMNINSEMQKELDKLSELYRDGEVSREDYEKRKADIASKYAIQSAKIAVSAIEDQLKVENLNSEDRLALEKKLAEAKVALSDKERDVRIKNNEDIVKSEEEKNKKIQDGLQMAGDFLNDFADLGSSLYDRRIQEVEYEQDVNDEAGEKEIERIGHLEDIGVITKEEAEARKRAAEQKTAEKEAELAKKKADLQTKQAKMEKANSIVQAIINTALAVMKQLAATPLPIGAPMVAMVTAMGAIQLATIMAQPIPKYAKGTDYHPGGLAVVGDGGKEEMVIADGKSWVTPSIPTLVSIPRGAMVLPDVMNVDSKRGMRSDVMLLTNEASRNGQPITVNVSNDYKRLEGGMDRLNSSFDKMAKYQRKANIQGNWRNIASRL